MEPLFLSGHLSAKSPRQLEIHLPHQLQADSHAWCPYIQNCFCGFYTHASAAEGLRKPFSGTCKFARKGVTAPMGTRLEISAAATHIQVSITTLDTLILCRLRETILTLHKILLKRGGAYHHPFRHKVSRPGCICGLTTSDYWQLQHQKPASPLSQPENPADPKGVTPIL